MVWPLPSKQVSCESDSRLLLQRLIYQLKLVIISIELSPAAYQSLRPVAPVHSFFYEKGNIMELKFRDDTYPIARHLEQIQMLYDYQTSRADKLQEALENYNKDEEIKERDERIRSLYKHSLVMLSDKELAAAKAFIERHWKNPGCLNPNSYSYRITGSGIGHEIIITCPRCGESKNITDYNDW